MGQEMFEQAEVLEIKENYELPEGWRWVRLGEVLTFVQNGFACSKKYETKDGVPHLRPNNIGNNGDLNLSKIVYIPKGIFDLSKYALRKGDVLFNNTNSKELVGRAVLVKENLDYGFSNHITRLRIDEDLMIPEWLVLVVNYLWFQGYFLEICRKWVGQAGISIKMLKSIQIPLPPIEEQKRIVTRIEKLFSRIDEVKKLRREALEQTKSLFSSVLHDIFSKADEKGWKWIRLGEICKVFSGSSAPQRDKYFKDGSYPFVRVKDLGRYGRIDNLTDSVDKVNDLAIKELRLIKAPKGTIVFPKSGEAILTNSRAILGVDAFIVSHLAALQPLTELVDPKFVYYWLCQIDMKDYIENPAYPSLKLSVVKSIQIPFPPLEEQRCIVAYLDSLQEKVQSLQKLQEDVDADIKRLRESILYKAFRGEL